MQVLVESTVVGETYFGRHPEQLEGLRQELRAIPRDRPVSVWSAGCASGEEPYTIAMLLLEEGRSAASVVATDVSEQGLGGARAARYGPWSLRGLPPLGRMRWLRQHGDGWVVCDEVRRLVRFQRHNLLHDPPPGKGFDVVLCRNVLIYFDRPTVDAAIRRLFESARHGGVVVLAPAEVPFAAPLGHARVDFRGGAFWRKGTATDTVSRAARGVSTGPRARPPPAAPRVPAPAEPLAGVAAEPSPPAAVPDPLEGARRAAAEGRWLDAEREACAVGERSLEPTPYLFAAAAAEARGDLQAAAHWLGRALFLAPDHVLARASTIPILQRLGRAADAARARREVLRALEHIPDERLLPGVEPIAAGALRSALLAKSSRERSE
jgi:chemotaxis protein methyltransferase CheR